MVYGYDIDYEIIFDGFITIDFENDYMPITTDPIIFTSKEQWIAFGQEYIPNYYELLYSYITLNKVIDFNQNSIIYYSITSPKSWYDSSYQIDKVVIKNDEIVLKFEDKPDYLVTVLNPTSIKHSYTLVIIVKKEDIPERLENIYQVEK